jgi:hypothetical protein
MGQVMETNFKYSTPATLQPLGSANGYQHLWLEGIGSPSRDNTKFSWLDHGHFYTLTSATNAQDELLFTRLGANDPEFNLRRDAALMIRRNDTQNTVFASIIEPHGSYSAVSEFAVNASSNIKNLAVVYDGGDYTAVAIEDMEGKEILFIVTGEDAAAKSGHQLKVGEKVYKWTGPYHLFRQ